MMVCKEVFVGIVVDRNNWILVYMFKYSYIFLVMFDIDFLFGWFVEYV